MSKTCDNKSVGVVIMDKRRRLLMIDRGNYPRCKAFPAGHLDGGDYPEMAITEVREEVGLTIPSDKLRLASEGTLSNPCKREGGLFHAWRTYLVSAANLPHLAFKAGDDAKRAFWADEEMWRYYAVRTEFAISRLGLQWFEVGEITLKIFGHPKTGPVTDEEKAAYASWENNPGMEPVWYYLLRSAGLFDWRFQDAPVGKLKTAPL